MSNIDPSIINLLRGRGDVGSDSVHHVHHLPRRVESADMEADTPASSPEEHRVSQAEKRPFLGQFMRSALNGIRRQEDGSAEV